MPQPVPPRVILLQPSAPTKPAEGAPCNGCGVCCAAEPCPLGMLLSRQRHGACKALAWDGTQARYLCGALANPEHWLPWLPRTWAMALVRRWIASARGCDAGLETV
jgi:hypothetical protein